MYFFGLFALLHKKRAKVLKKMQICKEMDKKFTLKCYFVCKDIRENAFSIILLFAKGYSRDICRVFVEYSWDIRMYRVCVGYISGMYRESVEWDGAQGGGWISHADRLIYLFLQILLALLAYVHFF